MTEWSGIYTGRLNFFGRRLKEAQFGLLPRIIKKYKLKESLEVGFGNGDIMKFLKSQGLKVCGIDYEGRCVARLKKEGFAAFRMDGRNMAFKGNSFQLVYSDGVVEHFEDPLPMIREEARVSKKYVLTLVPDHYSLFGLFMRFYHWATRFPREIITTRQKWIGYHEQCGLRIIEEGSLNTGEEIWLLCEKQ